MVQEPASGMYPGSQPDLSQYGTAVVSAIAFPVLGRNPIYPGIASQTGGSDDLSGLPMDYREGGVVLSKRASDELADFVAATQFDAVFPMWVWLHPLELSEQVERKLRKRQQGDEGTDTES